MTDGGAETTLLFLNGFDLPCFAAFVLLRDEKGREGLRKYFKPYLEYAKEKKVGYIVEVPTWRASQEWAPQIGMTVEEVDA